MSLTKIIRAALLYRTRSIERYRTEAEQLQLGVLHSLLRAGTRTLYGKEHGIVAGMSYEAFAAQVPVNTYDDLKGYIDRMRHGEIDILWPGRIRWYAKSSGTTNDKSKFIPVSPQNLRDTHYRGGSDALALYLCNNPNSRILDGRALILGGSHQPNYNLPHSLVGDLSAILIENIPWGVNLLRVPKKETALLADFELKRERIAREAIHRRVTNISGVPSWMLSVLTRVLEIAGAETLPEVWPHLEVFFHGGISFSPYRKLYQSLIPTNKMHYMETYNASEGFFGLQDDLSDASMLLMIDYGVFYEFIPFEELEKPNPSVVPLWGVKAGHNYAMVISTSCGLWRYLIGDTVRFTSTHPYKFVISGRTKSYINAFGEELVVDNAERALAMTCATTGAIVREYTAAPVFMDEHGQCRHQWLIEFAQRPTDLALFAQQLDSTLQQLNSDYEAKRHKNITLQQLEIIEARLGLFDDWLRSRGKLGGQHKVPRLSNSRDIIEQILAFNS